jgi:hypothetical protein
MPNLPDPGNINLMERFNSLEMLLENTQPKGEEYTDFFNIRKPLLGKETYLGFLQREDMLAMDEMVDAIQENLHHGLIPLSLDLMVKYLNNIRTTPSINGEFLNRITSHEFKYSQKQELHEYPHSPEKRGIFGKKKGG